MVLHFQVIHSRLLKSKSADLTAWNSHPGALVLSSHFSHSPPDFPFFTPNMGLTTSKFTAVIYATTSTVKESSPLSRLIKSTAQSQRVSKVNKRAQITVPCRCQTPVLLSMRRRCSPTITMKWTQLSDEFCYL